MDQKRKTVMGLKRTQDLKFKFFMGRDCSRRKKEPTTETVSSPASPESFLLQ
jgi:hypothetical protein